MYFTFHYSEMGHQTKGHFEKYVAFEADACDSKPEGFDEEIPRRAALPRGKCAAAHSLSEMGLSLTNEHFTFQT